MNVLIVSRDPAVESAVTALSQGRPVAVLTAASVAAALRVGMTVRVDVLVSDPLTLDEGVSALRRLYDAFGGVVEVIELTSAGAGTVALPEGRPVRRLGRPLDPRQLAEALEGISPPRQIPLRLHVASGTVSGPEGHVRLTRLQAELLRALAAAEGQPMAARNLLWQVWGYGDDLAGPELVRAHVRNLRRRLQAVDPRQATVETVPGRGYRLARPVLLA